MDKMGNKYNKLENKYNNLDKITKSNSGELSLETLILYIVTIAAIIIFVIAVVKIVM